MSGGIQGVQGHGDPKRHASSAAGQGAPACGQSSSQGQLPLDFTRAKRRPRVPK